jgi:hypothetical protein
MRTRWTPKHAVATTKRQVDAAVARLRVVALEWGDVDQTYVDNAEDFIRELEEFAERVEAEVAERLKAGEKIGI